MNVLPIVTALLLLMSLLATSFTKQHRSFEAQSGAYLNFMAAERDARQKVESEHYRNIKSVKKEAKKSKEKREKTNLRLAIIRERHPHSKLPIRSTVAEKLFSRLYSHVDAFKGKEKQILNLFSEKKETKWLDYVPKNKELEKLYLKLLRGTTYFDVENKIGYPPLNAYFTLEDREKPIHFQSAPPVLLEVVFGKKAEKILQYEKELIAQGNAHSLSEEELKELLGNDIKTELLDFSNTYPKVDSVDGKAQYMRVTKPVLETKE